MGTRADFYVGRGEDAEWLGSIAVDGYPSSVPASIRGAASEAAYRRAVAAFLDSRDDASTVHDGWPWPWSDSRTTDYAYALDDNVVWASYFGHEWFDAAKREPPSVQEGEKVAVFPDMTKRAQPAPAGSARSGVILFKA